MEGLDDLRKEKEKGANIGIGGSVVVEHYQKPRSWVTESVAKGRLLRQRVLSIHDGPSSQNAQLAYVEWSREDTVN